MGAYLDEPVRDLNPVDGGNSQFTWGACGMQGWRMSMEDAHICTEVKLPSGDTGHLFGVFDGHGGAEVSKFVEDNFIKILTSSAEWKAKNYEGALDSCFMKLDDKVSEQEYA